MLFQKNAHSLKHHNIATTSHVVFVNIVIN